MIRRISLAALAALTLVALLPAVVSAAYPQSCQTGQMTNPDGSQTYYQRYAAKYWPGSPYLKYTGSHGETRVRDLSPCTSPSQTKYGWTGVWGANLDNYGLGGDGFVQLGYVETSDICCINGLPANSRRFVYTSDDDAGGAFVEATWAGTPQVGVRYEFKIYSTTTTSGSHIWMYCIQNIDSGGAELCRSRPATWYQGARSMHMFETKNSHDQLGNGIDEPETLIVQMMYQTSNGEWWYYDQDTCYSGGVQPDYKCVDAGNYDIRGYTLE